jgi:hypothetical protein
MLNDQEVLDFLKAMADVDRLKIIGLLAQGAAPMDKITQGVSLTTRKAFNHLAFLEHVGMVKRNGEAYELVTGGLEKLAGRRLETSPAGYIPDPGLDENRRQVLADCLNADGTIRRLPNSRTQAVKFRYLLEYLLAAFQPGIDYTEKQVNAILGRFHEDTSGLRRDLVDAGMLSRVRDGSRYWRSEKGI